MSFDITGRTAIITGAARGPGLAIARLFVAEGANVIMADLDEEALDHEAKALTSGPGQVRVFAGDLREKLTVKNLLALAQDAFGGIDILVTAARQSAKTDPLAAEDRSLEDLIDRNLLASYRLCRAVARRMIRLHEDDTDNGEIGAIVNLTAAASPPREDGLAWSVSAAAVAQMNRALAAALAKDRIRVNGVALTGQPGNGAAGAVQYLVSEAATSLRGQNITVDGAWSDTGDLV